MLRGVIVVIAALWAAGSAAAAVVLLPSPTTRIGSEPPLGSAAPTGPVQLPRPPRADSRQQVLVDVAESGELVAVRVRQRLTLNGRGDYFFQIAAPVRDVRALPESQSEPGLRRSAILWQGFSPGRRVLAAELELEPAVVARTLPVRIERNAGAITLRNTTSVAVEGFTGKVDRLSMRRLLARISERPPATAPAIRVAGETRRRRLRAVAPLRIRGTIEREGRVLRRFGLVLGGPEPTETTISAPSGARVALTADPVPLVSDLTRAPRDAGGEDLLVLAQQALLRLARVNQYRSFLASPGSGTAAAAYRFRTVDAPAALPTHADDDGSSLPLVLGLGVGAVFALAGAVVVWAHL